MFPVNIRAVKVMLAVGALPTAWTNSHTYTNFFAICIYFAMELAVYVNGVISVLF